MRCLLDTHTLIWLSSDAPNLSERARAVLCAPETELFASLVSLWEMQIKASLGKLDVDIEIEESFYPLPFARSAPFLTAIAQKATAGLRLKISSVISHPLPQSFCLQIILPFSSFRVKND